jgi:hypothetical protein
LCPAEDMAPLADFAAYNEAMGEAQIREEKQPEGGGKRDAGVTAQLGAGVDVVRNMLAQGNHDPHAYAGVMQTFPGSHAEIAHLLQANVGNAFTQSVLAAATTTTTTSPTTALDPDDDPSKIPPEFTGVHDDVIRLLLRSRARLDFFKKNPGLKFWQVVRLIPTADLHTLVQIQKGAAGAGLWPMITELHEIYTYPTSWGVGFTSSSDPRSLTTNGDWGMDHPQIVVRSQHRNTKHEWFRQNTGAGNPGLHLGIDDGQGYHNVHWDPTNPMAFVGSGSPELVSKPYPHVEYHPKGWAVYQPDALVGHVGEIWGASAPSKAADATNGFLAVTAIDSARDQATYFINLEDGATPRTKDHARQAKALARMRAATSAITTLTSPARALAMQDDATSKPALDAINAKIPAARTDLVDALVELFQHMKAEAPRVDAHGYDATAGWTGEIWRANDTCKALVDGR